MIKIDLVVVYKFHFGARLRLLTVNIIMYFTLFRFFG